MYSIANETLNFFDYALNDNDLPFVQAELQIFTACKHIYCMHRIPYRSRSRNGSNLRNPNWTHNPRIRAVGKNKSKILNHPINYPQESQIQPLQDFRAYQYRNRQRPNRRSHRRSQLGKSNHQRFWEILWNLR